MPRFVAGLALCFAVAACGAPPPPVVSGDLRLPTGARVATLVAPAYDGQAAAATCKPFHRVFAVDGRQLTKDLDGEFPHHRGVFVGWNHVICGDATLDFWHCRNGEAQRTLAVTGGSDASQVATIAWTDAAGGEILRETRTVAVRPLADGAFALDVTSELTTTQPSVRLGGDPQHAGNQFRAVQRFADADGPKVDYVRPAAAGAHGNDVWTGCRWIAAVLPMAGGPVTVLRIEGDGNPPADWSTRPYGRFGAMWRAELTPTRPLRLAVTYVVADGARDAAWCDATAAAPSRR
ncbi:MAG: hypothetical protein FJ301_00360 [Planctomycetes bacterium]|nr:hypothetical protein [Planctomycetota bacterium]